MNIRAGMAGRCVGVRPGWMRAKASTPPAWVLLGLLAGLLPVLPSRAAAQPFGGYVVFSGSGSASAGNGYLEVPDSLALETLEAYLAIFRGAPAALSRRQGRL